MKTITRVPREIFLGHGEDETQKMVAEGSPARHAFSGNHWLAAGGA